jgi:hypothetical protein
MKRPVWISLVVAMVAAMAFSATAQADSPHFLSHSFAIDNSTGNLQCSFKEAGLGNTATTADITCTAATSEATYQCFNNGGNHPKAGNKETVGGLVTNTQSFPVRNGQTTGTSPSGLSHRAASAARTARRSTWSTSATTTSRSAAQEQRSARSTRAVTSSAAAA